MQVKGGVAFVLRVQVVQLPVQEMDIFYDIGLQGECEDMGTEEGGSGRQGSASVQQMQSGMRNNNNVRLRPRSACPAFLDLILFHTFTLTRFGYLARFTDNSCYRECNPNNSAVGTNKSQQRGGKESMRTEERGERGRVIEDNGE